MPDHSPAHLSQMAQQSAAVRRARLIERLISTAPPLSEEQVDRLRLLLHARATDGVNQQTPSVPTGWAS